MPIYTIYMDETNANSVDKYVPICYSYNKLHDLM